MLNQMRTASGNDQMCVPDSQQEFLCREATMSIFLFFGILFQVPWFQAGLFLRRGFMVYIGLFLTVALNRRPNNSAIFYNFFFGRRFTATVISVIQSSQ